MLGSLPKPVPRPPAKGLPPESPSRPTWQARRTLSWQCLRETRTISPRHFTLEAGGIWPEDEAPPVMRPMSAPRRLPSESIARRFPQQRPFRQPERPLDSRTDERPRPRRPAGTARATSPASTGGNVVATASNFEDISGAGRVASEASTSATSRPLGGPGNAAEKASGCPTCAICLEALSKAAADPCTLGLACGHAFHGACIQRWLSTARRRTCPLCNTKVAIGES